MSQKILAVDIGGTSSRFALFSLENETITESSSCWLKTAEFNSFEAELQELVRRKFLSSVADPDILVIAGAGPAERGVKIKLTQVPWTIDLEALPQDLKPRRATVINDFVAQAYACLSPIAKQAKVILPGTKDPLGPIAILGAGTGLGVAGMFVQANGHGIALPSEGGHVNYGGETEEEDRFSHFLAKLNQVQYASWEDALSGRGLQGTHEFLTGEKLSPADIGARLGTSPKTAELFARSYGRLCRNLALQYVASGGVFIAGGIAAKNHILLEHPAFQEVFRNPRQHKPFLAAVPVYLQDNEESGLWGSAHLGKQLLLGGSI